METKRCTVCGQILPMQMFYRRPDGRSRGGACKKCECARAIAWGRTKKGRKSQAKARTKYRSSEKGRLAEREYGRSSARKAVLGRYHQKPSYKASVSRQNRTKRHKEQLQRYAKTEKRKAASHRYSQTAKRKEALLRYHRSEKGLENAIRGVTRRRVTLASLPASRNTLTAKDWQEIKKEFKGKCAYCGRGDRNLTRDHFIPITKGGEHTRLNVIPSCRSCNSKKGNRQVPLGAYAGIRLPH
jgi:5-methylcytosine-specific restriction endonuclease McrA